MFLFNFWRRSDPSGTSIDNSNLSDSESWLNLESSYNLHSAIIAEEPWRLMCRHVEALMLNKFKCMRAPVGMNFIYVFVANFYKI